MENNFFKESCINLVDNKDMVTVANSSMLPAVCVDRNMLLPTLIPYRELSITEIKKEFNELKKGYSWAGVLKLLKLIAKYLFKTVRLFFVMIASIATFIGVSTLIVATIAIVTKNVVNSYYDVKPQDDDYTYSIFKIKDTI